MARKKPGLGRGLDALLSAAGTSVSSAAPVNASEQNALRQVPVEQIRRGEFQPRQNIPQQGLEELADSIRAQGLVQPVVLRPVDGGYELIAGERRWRASQLAGLHEIPAVIKDVPDQAAAAMALIENIQREDLSPLEESQAIKRLIEDFGLTHQQAAESVGRSRTAVTNLLRLLELEKETQTLLADKALEMGHARALLGLEGETQTAAARYIATKGLSVRETEKYIKQLKGTKTAKKQSTSRSPDIVSLEHELADQLGAPVSVQYNNRGKGQLIISYNSLDELDGVLEHIRD
jgi:ParB family chromosome partitioning protein